MRELVIVEEVEMGCVFNHLCPRRCLNVCETSYCQLGACVASKRCQL